MAAQDYASIVQQLYISYFGRPADYFGLQNFEAQLDAIGAPTNLTDLNAAVQAGKTPALNALINSFANSAESVALYGTDNSPIGISKFLVSVFTNVLGRAPELGEGWDFWYNALASGNLSRANAALAIAEGATTNTTAQGLLDAQTIANKQAVANAFTAALDTPTKINAYSTAAAVAVASGLLQGVTPTTDPAAYQATVLAAVNSVVATSIPTVTTALTAGVDTLVGGLGNDVFNGVIGTASNTNDTLTPLDSIDGGAGANILNVSILRTGQTLPAGLTVKNVQTVNVTAAAEATVNTSTGFTGVTNLNITSNGADSVTAGAGQAVAITNTAGTVTLAGGSTQNVTTAGGYALSGATGAITVVDTAQANVNSTIIDGTTVAVTSTTAGTGSITVGSASHLPTGTVTVTENLKGTGALTGGAITINGGTVDTVTVNTTQATAGTTTTVGTVTVNGSTATTSVSVTQTAAVAAVGAVTAIAGVTETTSAVFVALTAGQTLIVGGLTFTAGAAGTTAAQTAAAFANLANGATQGNSVLGTYSGTLSGWSTGANSTATVVFTSSTANTNVADLAFTGTGTAPTLTKTDGSAATAAVTGVGGIANGAVNITDVNYGTATAGKITSVTENGYASGFVKSDALATLSLANSAGATVSVWNNTATTLGLTVNKLGAASALNLDAAAAKYTKLNVTTATADSTLNVTGAAVTALTVNGSNAINLTGSTFSALATVTVSGAAGVTLNASGATVTDVNAAASSGANTFTIDASKATYEGGSGVDTVTLSSTTVSKAVALGAGNDTVVLASGTTSLGALVDGGAGTDTLSMVAADAATASGSATFAGKAIGFEHLTLTGGGTNVVDVAQLGNYNYVTSNGNTSLTLNNLASNGTLVFDGASTATIVNVSNASTGTADVLNVVISNAAGVAAGSLTAANVETVNITSTDTTTTHSAGTNTNSLTLVDTSATTIKVLGNANLTLTNTGNTAVTSIDASGMTGGLTVTTAGTVAETVKGGAGVNNLTAGAGTTADTLIGGASADVLTANGGLNTLTGGGGADTFVIGHTANVNTYATITDASVGDKIQLVGQGTEVFNTTKVTLAATAVFQDYANAVANAGGDSSTNAHIGWFQFGGDTYIVESLHDATASAGFINGAASGDIVVKLTGLVDLSHTSLNTGTPTLLIG